MARALLLGGAGFIGYHLARRLAEDRSCQVTIVDNLSQGQVDRDLGTLLEGQQSIAFHRADLTDARAWDSLGGPYDQVYLLAGVVGVRNVQGSPRRVLRDNTAIILNTLDWLARAGCGRLLFASTSEVYAGSVELGMAPVPTGEDVPLAVQDVQQPRATYAITKMLGEASVTHFARDCGAEAVIVRFHNVYGPRMGFRHVVPELMQRIHQRMDPLPVYGLEQTRAFCYISDAVDACLALMECRLPRPEIVNVGNGQEEVTIEGLVRLLCDVTGYHPTVQPMPAAPGSVGRRCPDTRKLHALTGFRPSVDLARGLALTWQWYRQYLDAQQHTSAAFRGLS